MDVLEMSGNFCSFEEQFKKAEKRLYSDPDSLKSRFKRLFCFEQADCEGLPLVCVEPLTVY